MDYPWLPLIILKELHCLNGPLVIIKHDMQPMITLFVPQLTLYRLDPITTQSGGAKATASEME